MTRVYSDDDLGAYLDGELNTSERSALEAELTKDSSLHARLEQLRGTWSMLELLEPSTVSDDFTKSTIAMTATRMRRESLTDWIRSRWQFLAGFVVALVLGFTLVKIPTTAQNQQKLSDIPLINDLDLYLRADSVGFLRELDAAELFAPDLALEGVFGEDKGSSFSEEELASEPTGLSAFSDVATTQQALIAMTEAQKVELFRQQERFNALKESEQIRLRGLYRQLRQDNDRERLYSVLVRYQQWLKTLDSSQRAELAGGTGTARIDHIRELQAEQERLRFVALTDESQMEPNDVDAIMHWLNGYLERHEDDFISQVPERYRRFFDDPQHYRRMIPVLVSHDRIQTVPPTTDEFDALTRAVSKQMAVKLGSINAGARVELVKSWLRSRGMSVRPPRPPVSQEELARFIREHLSDDDRQRMERLSGDEARDELMRMYFRKHRRHGGRRWRSPGEGRHPPPEGRDRPSAHTGES